ncbi:PTTG1IP family member 2 [Ochotona princeps]|uniref:PTTG1IP family member 2 n=1 Tax=Ochotona princeps TaxID=9978 RepID=UPI0027148CDD|nr:PTTG1IP family member 2 [Ochotona princeps]
MCWLRAWGQIFLPIFLSLFLIQLLSNVSDKGFPHFHSHRNWKEKQYSVEDACSQQKNCQSCTQDKKCVWCNEDRICKKYCFPHLHCRISAAYWTNCKIDVFGILMLALIAVLVVMLLWYCCAYHLYMQQRQAYLYGRNEPIHVHNWDAGFEE